MSVRQIVFEPVEPGIFRYWVQGKVRYCARVSRFGQDHKRQGFPSLELARAYRDQAHVRKTLTKHLPDQLEVDFAEAVDLYWSSFRAKGRLDRVRPAGIIAHYLRPAFGEKGLQQLTAADGLAYVRARQHAGVASGTLRREWQVLMRILNLAVKFDLLPKNKLAAVELPQGTKRDRMASPEELIALHSITDPECWRIVTLALLTGLRQGALLTLAGTRAEVRPDGPWLRFGAAASPLKRLPKEMPLTPTAWAALRGDIPALPAGELFRWRDERAFKRYWSKSCELAGIDDLHFHDLRHTCATRLQELGIDYEVRQALLGHVMLGTTADYSHGGPGWRAKLREAVTRLETAFPLPDWRTAGTGRRAALTERQQPRRTGRRLRLFSARQTDLIE